MLKKISCITAVTCKTEAKAAIKATDSYNTTAFTYSKELKFCHTRAQLTIPDHLVIISDDQLGPQVALYSTYPGLPATRWNSLKKGFDFDILSKVVRLYE